MKVFFYLSFEIFLLRTKEGKSRAKKMLYIAYSNFHAPFSADILCSLNLFFKTFYSSQPNFYIYSLDNSIWRHFCDIFFWPNKLQNSRGHVLTLMYLANTENLFKLRYNSKFFLFKTIYFSQPFFQDLHYSLYSNVFWGFQLKTIFNF